MSYTPIEGVHYIFDRYAFLNQVLTVGAKLLSEDSIHPDPQADIARTIKTARATYHPDRQSRAGEKMQREAERLSLLVDDCERILTNPELKTAYDDRLREFKKNKPQFVSSTGMPIVDLFAEAFDLESLLSDDIVDTSDFESKVKAMVQYDEKTVIQSTALFQSMPENEQIKALHRDILTKKLTYLSLLEDAAWMKIGIHNRKSKTDTHLTSADDYAEKVEDALKNIATDGIENHFSQYADAARIGMNKSPLLLQFNTSSADTTQGASGNAIMDPAELAVMHEKLKAKARQNFEIRADYVRDIARQKQSLLQELVKLSPVTALTEIDLKNPEYNFYLANPGDDGQVFIRLSLDAKTGQAQIAEFYKDGMTLSELKQRNLSKNSFLVERNTEIVDFLIEVSAAAERQFQSVKPLFNPDPTDPKSKMPAPGGGPSP